MGGNMTDLTGKWTMITGASRGVGSHVAEALARLGSNLILHSRSESHTAALAARAEALGVKVIPLAAELSGPAPGDCAAGCRRVRPLVQRPDLCRDDAGAGAASGPVLTKMGKPSFPVPGKEELPILQQAMGFMDAL
jgi:NAD(P)-dependent dehydrogenase (short-subunit alcohol dehydrogenase family)